MLVHAASSITPAAPNNRPPGTVKGDVRQHRHAPRAPQVDAGLRHRLGLHGLKAQHAVAAFGLPLGACGLPIPSDDGDTGEPAHASSSHAPHAGAQELLQQVHGEPDTCSTSVVAGNTQTDGASMRQGPRTHRRAAITQHPHAGRSNGWGTLNGSAASQQWSLGSDAEAGTWHTPSAHVQPRPLQHVQPHGRQENNAVSIRGPGGLGSHAPQFSQHLHCNTHTAHALAISPQVHAPLPLPTPLTAAASLVQLARAAARAHSTAAPGAGAVLPLSPECAQQLQHLIPTPATQPQNGDTHTCVSWEQVSAAASQLLSDAGLLDGSAQGLVPRQAAGLLWACGSLHGSLAPNLRALVGPTGARTPHEVLRQLKCAAGAMAVQLQPHLSTCPPQALANAMWALGQLRMRPGAGWIAAFLSAASRSLRAQAQQGQPPAAAAQRQRPAQPQSHYAGSDTGAKAPMGFKPQELSSMLWALATLRVVPPSNWVAALIAACVPQLQQRAFSQQGLANLLWAIAKLQLQPGAPFLTLWYAAFKATLPAASSAKAQPPTGAAPATSSAAGAPATNAADARSLPSSSAAAAAAREQQLHVSTSLWALTELHQKPSDAWVGHVLRASTASLPHAEPQSFSLTAVALGRLKHTPSTEWQRAVLTALTPERVAALPPKGVLGLLRGLAYSDVVIPPAWLSAATQAMAPAVAAGDYTPAQLSALAHALGMVCGGRSSGGAGAGACSGEPTAVHPHLVRALTKAATADMFSYARTAAGKAGRAQLSHRAPAAGSMRKRSQHGAKGQRRHRGGARSGTPPQVCTVRCKSPAAAHGTGRRPASRRHPAAAAAAASAGPQQEAGTGQEAMGTARQQGQAQQDQQGQPVHHWQRHQRRQQHQNLGQAREQVLTPRALARLVWGLWQCGVLESEHAHSAWRTACKVGLRASLPHMQLQPLTLVLAACAALRLPPAPQALRPALWRALQGARPNHANELVSLLCAAVRGGWTHSRKDRSWLSRCAARVAAHVTFLSATSLAQAADVTPSVSSSHAYGAWAAHMLAMAVAQEAPRKLVSLEPDQITQLAVGLARLPPYVPSATLPVRHHTTYAVRRYMRVGVLSIPTHYSVKRAAGGSSSSTGATPPATPASTPSGAPASTQGTNSTTSSSTTSNGQSAPMTPATSSGVPLVRPARPVTASHSPTVSGAGARARTSSSHVSGSQDAVPMTPPTTPLIHLTEGLFPLLPSLPARQLAGVGAALAAACASPGAAWVESFATAAHKLMPQPCLSAAERVGLLKSLRTLGGSPSPEWMSVWFRLTTNRLARLELTRLASAVRHTCDPTRAANLPPPPAAWVQGAAVAVDAAAGLFLSPAAQLGPALEAAGHSSTSMAAVGRGSSRSTTTTDAAGAHVLPLALFAGTAGRLHALGVPTTQRMRQGLAGAMDRVSAELAAGSVEVHELLHVVHELRYMQPATCGALPHATAVYALRGITAAPPGELFSAIWAAAAEREVSRPRAATGSQSAPGVPGASSVTAPPAPPSQKQQQAQGQLPPGAAAAAQLVSELFAALPRWGVSPPAGWLVAALRQCVARVACFSGTQAAVLVRSVALMRAPAASNPAVLELLEGTQPLLPHTSTAAVVDVAWALAALQLQPSRTWWAAYEDEVGSRMVQLPARALSELLWSLGAVGRRPGRVWMESYMRCVLAQLDAFDADMVARLVWSLAAVEEAPSRQLMDQVLARSTAQLAAAAAAPAAAATGGSPGGSGWAQTASGAQHGGGGGGGGHTFSAHTLALLVGGLAAMRVRPRAEWLSRFEAQLMRCLPDCRGVHLAKILSSFASLDFTPSEALLTAASARACALASELDLASAAELLWAAERLDRARPRHSAAGEARIAAFSAALAAAGLRPPSASASAAGGVAGAAQSDGGISISSGGGAVARGARGSSSGREGGDVGDGGRGGRAGRVGARRGLGRTRGARVGMERAARTTSLSPAPLVTASFEEEGDDAHAAGDVQAGHGASRASTPVSSQALEARAGEVGDQGGEREDGGAAREATPTPTKTAPSARARLRASGEGTGARGGLRRGLAMGRSSR